ncbi:MAG: hypothetical protein MUF84_15130 [Anaerolineae bacterium]|nr:hypothetical protein [Anaerolineae bacterium]
MTRRWLAPEEVISRMPGLLASGALARLICVANGWLACRLTCDVEEHDGYEAQFETARSLGNRGALAATLG